MTKAKSKREPAPRTNDSTTTIDGMAMVTGAIAEGQITPSEGAALSSMISGYSRAIEVLDLSRRIDAIEASLSPKGEK